MTNDYTQQLCDMFIQPVYDFYERWYAEAKRLNPSSPSKIFQLMLSRIKELSSETCTREYIKVVSVDGKFDKSKDMLISRLIASLFIFYVKTLLNMKQLDLKNFGIPPNKVVYHGFLIETARKLYQEPYLYSSKFDTIGQRENIDKVRQHIRDAIKTSIRRMISSNMLLNKQLDTQTVITLDDTKTITTQAYARNLNHLLEKELKTLGLDENLQATPLTTPAITPPTNADKHRFIDDLTTIVDTVQKTRSGQDPTHRKPILIFTKITPKSQNTPDVSKS